MRHQDYAVTHCTFSSLLCFLPLCVSTTAFLLSVTTPSHHSIGCPSARRGSLLSFFLSLRGGSVKLSKLSTANTSVARGSEDRSPTRSRVGAANASITSRPAQPSSPVTAAPVAGPLVTVGSNAPHGPASGHGAVPFSGLSLAPRRGKDGNTTMTLFVRNTPSATSGAGLGDGTAFLSEKDPGPDYGLVDDKEEGGDESNMDVSEAVGNAVNVAVETVSDTLPVVYRAVHRPANIVAGVFFYFILIVVYLLVETRHILNVDLALQSFHNDRLIAITSSLTEQLMARTTTLRKSRESGNATLVELLTLEEEAKAIDERRQELIKKLARQMSYPGPVEDIQFLIEEHVAYEDLVKTVAVDEEQWIRAGNALLRMFRNDPLFFDESAPPDNELTSDFDTFLYGVAVENWKSQHVPKNSSSSDADIGITATLEEVAFSISFAEESESRSKKVRDLFTRLRNSRVFAIVIISMLAVAYFRLA